MKKYLIILIILLLPLNCYASEKKEVILKSCIDGDTSNFIMNKKEIKVRFLAIDTPEVKHNNIDEEPYGIEAKNFTCRKLKNAKKIELEFDNNSDKKDRYDRYLAWVFVNDKLLQNEIVKNGLAEVTYLYGDYKYTDILKESQTKAILNKKGMYSNEDISKYSTTKELKERIKNITNKYIKKIKKDIIKYLNEILKEII